MAVDAPPPPAAPAGERESRRLLLNPRPSAAVARLEGELGVSNPVAQVLVRRGFTDPDEARAWLAAGDAHAPAEFRDIDVAVALIRTHVEAGTRITVHGDYDVDGVCSTAILVRALRSLGADVDWYLPSRIDDGYGLPPGAGGGRGGRGNH